MKTKLLALMATTAALSGCGAPSEASWLAATFGQDATLDNPYQVQAGGAASKPFFKKSQLLAKLDDADATADVLDGIVPESQASQIKLTLNGFEKLAKDGTMLASGKLDFHDFTRKRQFRGTLDDKAAYLSEQILFANLEGSLDDGNRFSLNMGEISPAEVFFTFKVTRPGEYMPLHQYSGVAAKGKLKLSLN